jgi:uncharacterized protein YrrD
MNLTTDAKLFNAQREEIGNLQRFVLDPKTKHITHIVFERGGLLNRTEYVLPMEWIDQITEEGIFLKTLPVDLDELPLFEEETYVITNERALLNADYVRSDPGLRMYYYYPPATYMPYSGAAPDTLSRAGSTSSAAPGDLQGDAAFSSSGLHKEYEENIPDNTVALKEGAKVLSQDSKHVGNVEKIFFDPRDNKATHLLITKGLLNKERRLVPVDWVESIYEDQVNLVLREELIENLPEFTEK